jgi:hypothetical protein
MSGWVDEWMGGWVDEWMSGSHLPIYPSTHLPVRNYLTDPSIALVVVTHQLAIKPLREVNQAGCFKVKDDIN